MSRRWSPEKARRARKDARLSQADVAAALDVQRTTVVTWENGQDPQLRYAAALADLLGLSLDELFVHDDEALTASAEDMHDGQEAPGNTNAPVTVGAGAGNAGGHEGALTKE